MFASPLRGRDKFLHKLTFSHDTRSHLFQHSLLPMLSPDDNFLLSSVLHVRVSIPTQYLLCRSAIIHPGQQALNEQLLVEVPDGRSCRGTSASEYSGCPNILLAHVCSYRVGIGATLMHFPRACACRIATIYT